MRRAAYEQIARSRLESDREAENAENGVMHIAYTPKDLVEAAEHLMEQRKAQNGKQDQAAKTEAPVPAK